MENSTDNRKWKISTGNGKWKISTGNGKWKISTGNNFYSQISNLKILQDNFYFGFFLFSLQNNQSIL